MKEKVTKKDYEAPALTVVSFLLEQGYTTSVNYSPAHVVTPDNDVMEVQDRETYTFSNSNNLSW